MKVENAVSFLAGWASLSLAAVVERSPEENHQTASELGPRSAKNRFSIKQVANPNFEQPSVTRSLIKAYAKYGGNFLSQLKEGATTDPALKLRFGALVQQGSRGSVLADPSPLDLEYVSPVHIGTPPQTLNLDVDTGSADLWVYFSGTVASQVNGQQQYRPENSTTSQRLDNEKWSVKYGDGSSVSGTVYTDRVAIGDTSFNRQAVQTAVQVSSSFTTDKFLSGILGLGHSFANTVRPDRQLTYMDNIKAGLERPLFTANLQRGQPGSYNFGYIDNTQFHGKIGYAPINASSPYWSITVDGSQIGSDGDFMDDPWDAIVDTGTSLLLVPQSTTVSYYDQVQGSGFDTSLATYTFPCNSTLPDFIFGIGSYRGIVPGSYLLALQVNETHCQGGIQSSEELPFSVLGDFLLKAQFVVFDDGNKRVGFANKNLVAEDHRWQVPDVKKILGLGHELGASSPSSIE